MSDEGKVVEVDSGGNAHNPSGRGASTTGDAAGNRGSDSCCGSSGAGRMMVDEDNDMNERAFQAAIYASGMDAVVDQYRKRMERMEADHVIERSQLKAHMERLQKQVSDQGKERKSMAKKLSEGEKEMRILRDKNEFLKSLNETLLRDKQAWNAEVERLSQVATQAQLTTKTLEEQLRDVMMHLETQSSIFGSSGNGKGSAGSSSGAAADSTSGSAESCRADVSELHGADVIRVGPSRRERLARKTNRRLSGT